MTAERPSGPECGALRHPPRGSAARTRLVALLLLAAIALAGCGASRRDAPAAAATPQATDSIPDAFAPATAALMWPGASRAFEITPAGDLFNGEWSIRVRPSAGGAAADAPRVIAYEHRWLPVAHWTRQAGSVRWDFEAAALPSPARGDSGLFVCFEARASNLGPAPSQATLELTLEPQGAGDPFVASDAATDDPARLQWASSAGGGAAEGWTDAVANGAVVKVGWTLAPGTSRTQRAVFPAYAVRARSLSEFARAPQAKRIAEARAHWNATLKQATQFELGDPEVEDAVRAALVVLLSCRERHGEAWSPAGNPFQYRDVWLRDAARVIGALAVAGFTRESRELASGLLRFQWPTGPFLSQRGQLDGTGQALWAFEQAMLRPAPADSLAALIAPSLAAWHWCEWQRQLSRVNHVGFAGMLPAADPRDNELVRAQLVGNDAWSIAGYRSLERLLRAAHRDHEADSVAVSRAGYVVDFLQGLRRGGYADVPPSWQGKGRDWGNLAVGYPCRVLPAGDHRLRLLAQRVWRTAGGAGLCAYGARDSLHGYLGADLGTWALLAGERDVADSVLAGLLAWRTASGGAAELFSKSRRDFGRNLPPHATGAAALVTLVRNALVFDDGDTLQLTLGARPLWWRGASLRGAPTRWGLLDLRLEHKHEFATWEWTPVPVWTALTLPPRTRLAGAPEAPLVAGPGQRTVLAPPGTRRARVAVTSDHTGDS